ncbi:MAG: cobaltochelatase subunit CobN, partial [Cyanobacteriota bacterium]
MARSSHRSQQDGEMHRLPSAANPGVSDGDGFEPITHPPAAVVVLSSAETDLLALANVLRSRSTPFPGRLQALPLASLSHPAAIDHYISSALERTRVLVVRLLGGRGHWSYGLEQLQRWQQGKPDRHLLLLAGTPEEEGVLASLSSLPEPLTVALAACCRVGGPANLLLLVES